MITHWSHNLVLRWHVTSRHESHE